MSDKEYNVTTSCISTNLSETPNLPPSFRENVNRTKESIRLLADKVNLSNHSLLSRTVVVMTVDVQYALLELCNGPDAESPLAELAVSIPKSLLLLWKICTKVYHLTSCHHQYILLLVFIGYPAFFILCSSLYYNEGQLSCRFEEKKLYCFTVECIAFYIF